MTGDDIQERLEDIEVVPPPTVGRQFSHSRRVRMGDADPSGRLRADAAARYLQDVAQDDIRDAGHDPLTPWIARRTVLVGERWPRLDELVEVTTFGSGFGRSWAERRTIVEGEGTRLDGVALWIYLDLDNGMPKRLGPEFHETYDEAIGGRRVSARLRLGGPPPGLTVRPWSFRHVDVDGFGHVNNAASWALVEEELAEHGLEPCYAELEYIRPIPPRQHVELQSQVTRDVTGAKRLDIWLTLAGQSVAAATVRARHPGS